MVGVEGEEKEKNQRAKRVSVRGRFDPFSPFLRPATQALLNFAFLKIQLIAG